MKKRSDLWYLLAVLGFIGSLVGYLFFRKTEKQKAHIILVVGIVVGIFGIFLNGYVLILNFLFPF